MRKWAQYAVTVRIRNIENERGNDNSPQNQNFTYNIYNIRAPGKLRPHMDTRFYYLIDTNTSG